MIHAILINHNEHNNIGTLTLNTEKNTCTLKLNKKGKKYKKACALMINLLIKQLNKNYHNQNLTIHNADQNFFNALKQELLLVLDISTKTIRKQSKKTIK